MSLVAAIVLLCAWKAGAPRSCGWGSWISRRCPAGGANRWWTRASRARPSPSAGGRSIMASERMRIPRCTWISTAKSSDFKAMSASMMPHGRRGSIRFMIYGDGKRLFDSGVMKGGQEAKAVDVPLAGVRRLMLMVTSAGDGTDFDHADWAQAEFVVAGEKPIGRRCAEAAPGGEGDSDAQTRAAAADQRAEGLRRPAGTTLPLSNSLHGTAADSLHGDRLAEGPPA